MKKLNDKQNNKTIKKETKNNASNPIEKVKSPIEDTKMISVPKSPDIDNAGEISKVQKKLNKLIKPISITEENSLTNIVETINNFNSTRTKAKNYTNKLENSTANYISINYFDIMKSISDIFNNNRGIVDLISQLNNIFVNKLKWGFVGFGLLHEKSKCINLKIYSNVGNSYTSKVFLSDENNPIIKAYSTKTIIDKDNINYLNNPYLIKSPSVIFPMISVNKCIGVMIVGQNIANLNTNLITFLSNFMGMYIHNAQLLEQTNKFANTDTLTSLYNHRGFQEILAKELDVPIITLSQLSRAVEGRNDKRPMLSDLRESGSIEQDADIVMFIYREDYYNKGESEEEENVKATSKGLSEVIIAKHRNGPVGTVKLLFQGNITKFKNPIDTAFDAF